MPEEQLNKPNKPNNNLFQTPLKLHPLNNKPLHLLKSNPNKLILKFLILLAEEPPTVGSSPAGTLNQAVPFSPTTLISRPPSHQTGSKSKSNILTKAKT